MTGFGQGSAENQAYRVTVTLRGVNHRFLDLHIRLREEHRAIEPSLRSQLAERLLRGRVEVTVDIDRLFSQPVALEVNEALVGSLRKAADDLEERGLINGGPSFSDLVRMPDVLRFRSEPATWSEDDQQLLAAATAAALDELVEARGTEGGQLLAIFGTHLTSLSQTVDRLTVQADAWRSHATQALRERVGALLDGAEVDEQRVLQEVALLADRSDVAEELDRLRSHLTHFSDVMAREGSVGKRLDFLTQEVFRELNTIGSKCRDAEMTRLILDGKAGCEKIREQVQNVE